MVAQTDSDSSKLDVLKLGSAGVVIALAVAAFYVFSDAPTLFRVLGVVAAVAVAAGIAYTTSVGQSTWGFMRESRSELRKVVWPTRQETIQTTLIVMAVVVLVALFLWLLDSLLLWLVKLLTG